MDRPAFQIEVSHIFPDLFQVQLPFLAHWDFFSSRQEIHLSFFQTHPLMPVHWFLLGFPTRQARQLPLVQTQL